MYKLFLCKKTKQTGRPRHKESATQRHVAAQPTQTPHYPNHHSTWTPHTPTVAHTHTTLSRKKERWRRRREVGEAKSDFHSGNVTTSQRGPHDTATKSELMDSFLTPVNMTGGVCVTAERGLVRVPACPTERAARPTSTAC